MGNMIAAVVVGALCGLAGGFVLGMKNGIVLYKLNRPFFETPQTCTLSEPHVCRVNGPCNGWPKDQSCEKCGTSWTANEILPCPTCQERG